MLEMQDIIEFPFGFCQKKKRICFWHLILGLKPNSLCYLLYKVKSGFLTSLLFLVCKNVIVFPSRAVAIENALLLFSPQLAVVDEHLTRHLPKQWLTSLAIEVQKLFN